MSLEALRVGEPDEPDPVKRLGTGHMHGGPGVLLEDAAHGHRLWLSTAAREAVQKHEEQGQSDDAKDEAKDADPERAQRLDRLRTHTAPRPLAPAPAWTRG